MPHSELVDLTVLSQNFPTMPWPEINRDNHLDTIESIIGAGVQVIVLEGDEGIGKTTLLGKFALRHPLNTFSLFIRPNNRWASDPQMLQMDFSNQLEWALSRKELRDDELIDEGLLRSRIFALRKRARRERFFFVIDGLLKGLPTDHEILIQILDWLPIGLSNCHILFSGNLELLPESIKENYSCKSYPLSFVTPTETTTYFQQIGLELDRSAVEEIHRICRGIPGRLAIVRRILETNPIHTVTENVSDRLSDLFEIEWQAVSENNKQQNLALAIVTFDQKSHRLAELAELLNLTPDNITQLLQPLRFINIDPANGEVTFDPESFRAFAAEQLRFYKTEVTDLVLDYLLKEPNSDRSMAELPRYLSDAGRYDTLLNHLTPQTFDLMIDQSKSLIPIRNQAELGVNAALKLGRVEDLVRLSLYRSVAEELNKADVLRSEIEAHLELGDPTTALNLAQNAVLNEDRLHLLAVIARNKRESGEMPEPALLEQIKQLHDRIDRASLGNRAIEIASDLLATFPDLAIEMVDQVTAASTIEQPDLAFAKLSLAAVGTQDETAITTNEKILERIKDPTARRLSAAVATLVGDYSAERLIKEVRKLESASDQLFLVKEWTRSNRKKPDAATAVDFGFQLAIRATEQTITARDYRDLAAPLPFITDLGKARHFVDAFDSQKGAIRRISVSVDYIGLQLILAETQARYDAENAHNRVLEAYLYDIAEIDDVVIRAECLARLTAALSRMKSPLVSEVEQELDRVVKDVVAASAEHYHSMRGVIKSLARTRPQLAQNYAELLNVQDRRDLALSDLIGSYIRTEAHLIDVDYVEGLLNRIVNRKVKDATLVEILDRLRELDSTPEIVKSALRFINRVDEMQDADNRCNAYCTSFLILNHEGTNHYVSLSSQLLTQLTSTWEAIDVGWAKVDTGFQILQSLAARSKELASEFMAKIELLRKEIVFDAENIATAYIACIRLAIRAYAGLLPRNFATDQDLEILGRLITLVPSNGERASLWADIALCHYSNGRIDICRRIVQEYVKPLLQNISDADRDYRESVTAVIAPALYLASPTTAPDILEQLLPEYRDRAYWSICGFVLTKTLSFDPYDASEPAFDLTYDTLLELIKLMERMEVDILIHRLVETIVTSMTSRRHHAVFSQAQKLDIAHKLEVVVNGKLPNARYIQHEGYKIAALAHIAKLRQAKPEDWINLIDQAKKIANASDRVLVLSIIAGAMPSSQSTRRKEVILKAQEEIKQIPFSLDRAGRYSAIGNKMREIDPAFAKECLRQAMQVTVDG